MEKELSVPFALLLAQSLFQLHGDIETKQTCGGALYTPPNTQYFEHSAHLPDPAVWTSPSYIVTACLVNTSLILKPSPEGGPSQAGFLARSPAPMGAESP